MKPLKFWWSRQAIALLTTDPAVCFQSPKQRLARVLGVASALGVLPGDVLRLADLIDFDPTSGQVYVKGLAPGQAEQPEQAEDPARVSEQSPQLGGEGCMSEQGSDSLNGSSGQARPLPARQGKTTAKGARPHRSPAPKREKLGRASKGKSTAPVQSRSRP